MQSEFWNLKSEIWKPGIQSQEYKTKNIEPGIYNQEYKAVQGEAAKQGRGRQSIPNSKAKVHELKFLR